MTTTKTPEQIADEVSEEFYEFGPPEDGIRSGYLEAGVVGRMIVAAIEVDRAQRNTGAPDFPIDDALALGIPPVSRVFVENVTGEALSDEQFERVCRAVPRSSIPDALSVIVETVLAA